MLANGEVENGFRPRIVVNMLDGQRPLIDFTKTEDPDDVDLRPEGGQGVVDPRHHKLGRFLTLAKFASSLSGERLSTLGDGCRAFAIERNAALPDGGLDASLVQALGEHAALVCLYRRLMVEHERVSGGRIAPDHVHSAASYGRAALEAAQIEPPLARNPDFPRQALAIGMEALYGGEALVGVRTPYLPLPCLFLDVTSVYPVVASLAGVDHLLKADRLEVHEEDPSEVSAWLASLTADDLLDPRLHAELAFRFLELVPDGRHVFPHRLPAAKHWKTQVGELVAHEPLVFTAADARRASLETGPLPPILRAIRIAAHGRQRGLKAVTLPSGRTVLPSEDLLFALAEERLAPAAWPGAKAAANACSSGIFAQLNDGERRARVRQRVWRADGRTHTEYGLDVEEPGRWYSPPFAATVMGGGRLLQYLSCALLERVGGTIAYRDTDAPAVVATREGGLVPCEGGPEVDEYGRACVLALSFAEVESA